MSKIAGRSKISKATREWIAAGRPGLAAGSGPDDQQVSAGLPDWVRSQLAARQEPATCMHGVTSPCGLCGAF